MAIEQWSRGQVACKVVDMRKPESHFGRPEEPAAAEDVDSRVQMRKVKAWADQQKRQICMEDKLKLYLREVEILASISHVSYPGCL